MAAVVSVTNVSKNQDRLIVQGTIAVSGSYPGTPGDTLSFAGFDQIKSNSAPQWVEIFELPPAGTSASGLIYNFAIGTTMANGQLQVFIAPAAISEPMAQLGNVTYASVNAAHIVYRAEFFVFI